MNIITLHKPNIDHIYKMIRLVLKIELPEPAIKYEAILKAYKINIDTKEINISENQEYLIKAIFVYETIY